ncbi:MAG: hypothetical protein ACJ8G2_12610 [Burkholderiales bacterium]|jgi:hypothetical protein
MLRELSHVRQISGGRPRRWFQSHDEDLIVWYAENGSIYGFQFCYGRNRKERALTWTAEQGFSHNKIDAGDRDGMRYAGTPILVADGIFDADIMVRRFAEISSSVPVEIRQFVLNKVREYPHATHNT